MLDAAARVVVDRRAHGGESPTRSQRTGMKADPAE